nr:cation:proton antiporter [Aquisphaera insulae]
MAHGEETLISTVAVGLSYAFGGGLLAARLGLPPLVGYLVAGIAVGPFTPGFVADTALAPQLAEIGVILLMFGVGMHFSIKDLLAVRKIAVPGAVAQITVATAMGVGLALLWGWSLMAGLIFGLALSVASTVVLLRALEDRHLLHTGDGQIAVGWLVVEDLAMVLALVLLPALAGGNGEGGGLSAWELFQALALTLAKVAAFVAVMLVVGVRIFPWILARVEGLGSRELFTLAVIALSLGVAFLAARIFGVSYALGAFFAGVVVNESELSRRAARDLQPLQDAFAALFFVSVGMLFDPSVLTQHPLPLLAVVAVILVGKSVAAFAIVVALGKPRSTALTVSASLAQIGEFSFILASLGLSLKLLPPEGQSLIVAGAILSIILNPLGFKLIEPWTTLEAHADEPDRPAPSH